jgi:hypothetical protein
MNRKIFTAGLSAAAVLALTAASASAVVIGDPSQQSQQGVNGSQLSNGPTATGIVIGPGGTSVAPSSAVQNATNIVGSAQAVGGNTENGQPADVLISPDNIGPSQSSQQGVNAAQGSENSAIGTQNMTNLLGNAQIIGGDLDCLFPGADCTASTIIGSPKQVQGQALNYSQAADGGVTTGDSYLLPAISFNGLTGPTSQNAVNGILNTQLIIG